MGLAHFMLKYASKIISGSLVTATTLSTGGFSSINDAFNAGRELKS
jgi:hypothetical protein